jgi:hypothetical protein
MGQHHRIGLYHLGLHLGLLRLQDLHLLVLSYHRCPLKVSSAHFAPCQGPEDETYVRRRMSQMCR